MKTNERGDFLGRKLDTLAQVGTSPSFSDNKILHGGGYDISDAAVRYRMVQKKFLTQNLILLLIDIAKEKKNTVLIISLWNAYHCLDKIHVVNDRIYGKRCKTRFCTVCNGIRKATLVNNYKAILDSWKAPQFLTLTWKSCSLDELYEHLNETIIIFNRIKAKLKKRHQRGKGPKIIGIRSIEANFNPETKTYNPHIHILIPNLEIANLLRNEWIAYFNDPKIATPKAQLIRQVIDTEKDLIEVIKYASTVFTDKLKSLKRKRKNKDYGIYVRAMYNLVVAMSDHRLFASFGFQLPKNTDQVSKSIPYDSLDEFKYQSILGDYLNEETAELLLQAKPSYSLIDKVQHDVDTTLE